MGQQQLLLIALSVIIVGAAVAVGVNMLQKGSEQAKMDKFYQQASIMSTNIAATYKKPRTMGGLGQDYTNISAGSGVSEKCSLLGIKDSVDNSKIVVSGIDAPASDSITITLSNTQGAKSNYSGTFAVNDDGELTWTTPVTE